MTYSKSSLIQDIRDVLNDEPWETTSTTTATTSPIAVPDGTKWAAGDILEWPDTGTVGGEQALVRSVSSNDLTVDRGFNGTTAEAHTSGDRVVKNPRYSTRQITEAIDKVVNSLYPTAWKSTTTSLTPDTTTVWFDSELSGTSLAGLIDFIKGEQLYGASSQYIGVYGASSAYLPMLPIRVERNLPTALVASTVGVAFPAGFHHSSNEVVIYWRVKIEPTVSGGNYSDLTEGLLTEAVVNGVAARLVSHKEIPNISEDGRTGQTEVGSFVGTGSWFELKYKELLTQYNLELMRSLPPAPDQNYIPGWW